MPARSRDWTLTEAARLLDQPQHRLIYLCEKGVVVPDVQDAEGRGSSRRFSRRNLLEFAVGLKMRELELPVSIVAAAIRVLRSFEHEVAQEKAGFRIPESLRATSAPDLRIVIGDGQLFFTLAAGARPPKVYGGIPLSDLDDPHVFPDLPGLIARDTRKKRSGFGPEGSRYARMEVSVTGIAQDLPI